MRPWPGAYSGQSAITDPGAPMPPTEASEHRARVVDIARQRAVITAKSNAVMPHSFARGIYIGAAELGRIRLNTLEAANVSS